jgi:succinate dehydrogenase/fumarate reductase-like Fe-S protein
MLITNKRLEEVVDTFEVPLEEGREDCACGAVLREATRPEYNFAVSIRSGACPTCSGQPTDAPPSGVDQPEATQVGAADTASITLVPAPSA